MKKKILSGIIAALSLVTVNKVNVSACEEWLRVAEGNYYDYMTVVTLMDGNEWLIDENYAGKSCFDENGNVIFEEDEPVFVVFDNNGTCDILTDDIIIYVGKLD